MGATKVTKHELEVDATQNLTQSGSHSGTQVVITVPATLVGTHRLSIVNETECAWSGQAGGQIFAYITKNTTELKRSYTDNNTTSWFGNCGVTTTTDVVAGDQIKIGAVVDRTPGGISGRSTYSITDTGRVA